MNGQVLAIAVLAAVAAWLLVRGLMRSPTRLAVRLAPYTDRARGQLGTATATRPPSSRSAWGPMVTAVAERLGGALGSGSTTELELRLRRAGLGTLTAAAFPPRPPAHTRVRLANRLSLGFLLRVE